MATNPDKLADLRVQHLEMVQGVVARMAGQGAVLKNYCLTLTTAVAGFAITLGHPIAVLIALVPITIFALLDAQYLRLERHFRGRFDHIRKEKWSVRPNFEISADDVQVGYWDALASWSIVYFYLPLAIAVVIVVLIAGYLYGKFL